MKKVLILALLLMVVLLGAWGASGLSFAFNDVRVVYAKAPNWSSDLVLAGYAGHPLGGNVTISNCRVGPLPSVTLAGHAGAVVKNYGALQCGEDFGLLSISDQYRPASYLRFNDGVTRTSVHVPPLTTNIGVAGQKSRAGGVRNVDGSDVTHLALFNVGTSGAFYTVEAVNTAGVAVGTETILAEPGMTFYRLRTPLESGSITIRPGLSGVGCPGCDALSETYGFVTVGPVNGETVYAQPLEAQITIPWPPG